MAVALGMGLVGCGRSLPRPPLTAVDVADYIAVPLAPRAPPVEFIPPAPSKDAVWIDGSWEWTGGRYGWRYGTWVVPPPGVRYARWTVVRREEDGQLFFAPSSWKDTTGKTVESRGVVRTFGAVGRARTRIGGAPVGGQDTGQSRGQSAGQSVERTPPVDMDVESDLEDP